MNNTYGNLTVAELSTWLYFSQDENAKGNNAKISQWAEKCLKFNFMLTNF
jgi:hypothetical protein